MSPGIKRLYERYMSIRFPGRADIYIKEWEKRFINGMEWQKSDYNGREILKEIAPHIYPENKDEYFIRKDNNTTIIIDVEGGLIQEIHDKPDNITIVIRDYDIEGSEEDKITLDENNKGYVEIEFWFPSIKIFIPKKRKTTFIGKTGDRKMPERLRIWNVQIFHDGEDAGRIQVCTEEKNFSDTVELRVQSYYQSITKKHIKVTVKARPLQNRKLLLRF